VSPSLVGFKRLGVPKHFVPQVVEYYAGKYYVISPLIPTELVYTVEEAGELRDVSFLPHNWMAPAELLLLRDLYTHRYDGVMLSIEGKEYRAKFDPSLEIQQGHEVWEVRERKDALVRVRNRYGKGPVSLASAHGRIRSCLRAADLIKTFSGYSVMAPFLTPSKSLNQNSSAKVLFLCPHHDPNQIQFCFFRDKKSNRLDLYGGILELGESPIDALVREVREEAMVHLLPSRVFPLGANREVADTVTWTTHLFIAEAPEELVHAPGVEIYTIRRFYDFNHSFGGRPRQVWLSHYLNYLSGTLYDAEQAWVFLEMSMGLAPRVPPNMWVRKMAWSRYASFLYLWLEGSSTKSEDVANVLKDRGFWIDEEGLTSLLSVYFPVLKPSSSASLIPPPLVPGGFGSSSSSSTTSILSAFSSLTLADDPEVPLHSLTYPTDVAGSKDLLKRIFQSNPSVRAQDFYSRCSKLGYLKGRKPALRWVESLLAQGIMRATTAVDGGGRIFHFKSG
jgi:8-oxo-dGTP pyrophosphatase MutT (NUDIX family)